MAHTLRSTRDVLDYYNRMGLAVWYILDMGQSSQPTVAQYAPRENEADLNEGGEKLLEELEYLTPGRYKLQVSATPRARGYSPLEVVYERTHVMQQPLPPAPPTAEIAAVTSPAQAERMAELIGEYRAQMARMEAQREIDRITYRMQELERQLREAEKRSPIERVLESPQIMGFLERVILQATVPGVANQPQMTMYTQPQPIAGLSGQSQVEVDEATADRIERSVQVLAERVGSHEALAALLEKLADKWDTVKQFIHHL